jgi:hypothetical protein
MSRAETATLNFMVQAFSNDFMRRKDDRRRVSFVDVYFLMSSSKTDVHDFLEIPFVLFHFIPKIVNREVLIASLYVFLYT